jgi:phosphoglycolate phosphatase
MASGATPRRWQYRAMPNLSFKLVVFDFDGTLAASFPWFLEVFDEVAERYRFRKLEYNVIDELRHLDARQFLAYHDIPHWKLPFVSRHFQSLMQRDIVAIRPVAGIRAALACLAAKGLKLGILTSNSRQNVTRVLGRNTAELFQYWECGSGVFGKGAKLRKLLRKSGYTHSEVIFVGDEIRDAQAAHEARVAFGAVAWGFTYLRALTEHSAAAETFLDPGELVVKVSPA